MGGAARQQAPCEGGGGASWRTPVPGRAPQSTEQWSACGPRMARPASRRTPVPWRVRQPRARSAILGRRASRRTPVPGERGTPGQSPEARGSTPCGESPMEGDVGGPLRQTPEPPGSCGPVGRFGGSRGAGSRGRVQSASRLERNPGSRREKARTGIRRERQGAANPMTGSGVQQTRDIRTEQPVRVARNCEGGTRPGTGCARPKEGASLPGVDARMHVGGGAKQRTDPGGGVPTPARREIPRRGEPLRDPTIDPDRIEEGR